MNKTGKGSGLLVMMVVLMSLAVVGLGAFLFKSGTFATTEEASSVAAVVQRSADANLGKSATMKVRSYNRVNDTQPQVAATLYMVETVGDNKRLISDGTALSATADTSVATTVGAKIYGVAFSGTYYGTPKEIDVTKEVEPFYLDVNEVAGTGAGNVNITTWKDSSNAIGNITLGAGQTDTWDKIRIKVNTDQRAFNFKGIVFNLTSSSNVDRITIAGLESASSPKRLSVISSAEYYFVVPEAKLLKQWDTFDTGVVAWKATSTNPAESFDILVIDEAYFRSVDRLSIKKGVEDDQPTPVDTGQGDVRYTGAVV